MDTLEVQLVEAIRNGRLDVVEELLDKGCYVNVGDSDGVTPLHLAAMRDHQEIARLLLDHGATVNVKTLDKMTPLHYAACRGLAEMVQLLIEHGATVDSQDANDRTALIMAISRHHLDVVEMLIKHKALVNMEEIHGYTPLCEAVWRKSVEMAEALLRAGAKPHHSQHLLHYTVRHRHLAMAALLLRYGTYPNLRDDLGDTPLLIAINFGHIPMVKLLLEQGASPNCANSLSGTTPLCQAAISNAPATFNEILSLLCQYNVDLNMPSVGTPLRTPLQCAIMEGRIVNAVSLIRAGASVNNSTTQCDPVHFNLPIDLLMKEPFSFLHLLITAGYDLSHSHVNHPKDLSELDVDTIEGWLAFMKYNPRRLSDLCRLNIREQMGNQLLQIVPNLDIPFSLKKFLFFEDIYCDLEDGKPLTWTLSELYLSPYKKYLDV